MTNEKELEEFFKNALYKTPYTLTDVILDELVSMANIVAKNRKSKILDLPRTSGKARECIKCSETQNIPILCMNKSHAKIIQSKALAMESNIPKPITIEQLGNETPDSVIVYELPLVFKKLLDLQCGKKVNVELMT